MPTNGYSTVRATAAVIRKEKVKAEDRIKQQR
jgi:hypothetical protein